MSASLFARYLIAGTMMLPSLAVGPDSDDVTHEMVGAATGKAEGGQPPAPAQIAQWAAHTGDNGKLPFLVVDKTYAQLYVFDAAGELQAVAPVTVDAVDSGPLHPASVSRPEEHDKLPAGRFIAERRPDRDGKDAIRIGDAAAVQASHRADNARAASPQSILRLPVSANEGVIDRTLAGQRVVIYVLPESGPVPAESSDSRYYAARQR